MSSEKQPFPFVFSPETKAERDAKISQMIKIMDLAYRDEYSEPSVLLKRPLLRAHMVWYALGHNGLSPFVLASLTETSVSDVLEQAIKEGIAFSFCAETRLPVTSNVGYIPTSALNIARFNNWVNKPPDWMAPAERARYKPTKFLTFEELETHLKSFAHPRQFRQPGKRGVIRLHTWNRLRRAVRLEEDVK